MERKDIRWHQRFQNFEKALHYLEAAMNIKDPDIIQKAGLIQFFEMSFELSWNLIKDYLEEQGFVDISTPRGAIKKGFEIGLISDGHLWMKLLEDRNLTSNAYDEKTVTEIEHLIREHYFPLLKGLHATMKQQFS